MVSSRSFGRVFRRGVQVALLGIAFAGCGRPTDYTPDPLPNGEIPGKTVLPGEAQRASIIAASAAAQAEGKPDPTFFSGKPFSTEGGFLASFQEPNVALAAKTDFHIDPRKVSKDEVTCFGTYVHCHPGVKAGDYDYMASMVPGTNKWAYYRVQIVFGPAEPGQISLADIVGRVKQGNNEMEERGLCTNPKPVKPVRPIVVHPTPAREVTPKAVATKPAIIIPAPQPESHSAVAIANNTNNIVINAQTPIPASPTAPEQPTAIPTNTFRETATPFSQPTPMPTNADTPMRQATQAPLPSNAVNHPVSPDAVPTRGSGSNLPTPVGPHSASASASAAPAAPTAIGH